MALLTAMCLIWLLGCATAGPGVGIPAVSAINGMAASRLPPALLDKQLAAMRVQGVEVVRSDAPWAEIEPRPPSGNIVHYNFAQFDAWVTALARNHLRWQPLIDFAVGWAKVPNCVGFCPPSDNATYAAFAAAVARRYGVGGSFWSQRPQLPYYPAQIFEVWNEENVPTYSISPARYGPLYAAARAAIHLVDPTASVIVGGLADDSRSFDPDDDYPARYVQRMLAADPALRGHVDGFGLHPYGATANDVQHWVAHFRQVLNGVGEASAPIDITEIGWTTGDLARELWRASMMTQVAIGLGHSNCGVRLLAPYDWINPAGSNQPDFGLVDLHGLDTTLRPAGAAWFFGLHRADQAPQVARCPPAGR